MKKQFEILNEELLCKRFLRLNRYELRHESFYGGWCEPIHRERLEGHSAVSVLLFDPDMDRLVLVEQFRIGAVGTKDEPWLVETIGGYLEPGESPEQVAVRETLEEAGLEIHTLRMIGDFYVCPGTSSERIYLYIGLVDSSEAEGIYGLPHEGEEMRVLTMSVDEARRELFGRLNSTSVVMAVQWLLANREEVGSWVSDRLK